LTGPRDHGKPSALLAHCSYAGKITLIKPDLGTKRVCPSCAARFYDLEKRPIECPKCAFTFEPDALLKQRRPRTPAPEPEKEKAPPPSDTEKADQEEIKNEEDEEDKETVDEVDNEITESDSPGMSISDGNTKSESDEDDGEDKETANNDVADIDDDLDDDLDDDEDDDTLLEHDDDDDDDVTNIIDADITKEDT
jgi:uncharacterized protein (TIGR02300 family)